MQLIVKYGKPEKKYQESRLAKKGKLIKKDSGIIKNQTCPYMYLTPSYLLLFSISPIKNQDIFYIKTETPLNNNFRQIFSRSFISSERRIK